MLVYQRVSIYGNPFTSSAGFYCGHFQVRTLVQALVNAGADVSQSRKKKKQWEDVYCYSNIPLAINIG